jgi:putative transposase
MLQKKTQGKILEELENTSKKSVDMISYCLMPTHLHLLLRQNVDDGITNFMKRILDSYTKNFNKIHKRNGPLWASRFKDVLVNSDGQLLHLTRYIHLNPNSAGLVKKPEEWRYSSYNDYISKKSNIINPEIIEMTPAKYREFVEDRKDYQKQLSIIKSILIDKYSG